MRRSLTARQRKVYDWIRSFFTAHLRMPAMREVAEVFEFSVTSAQNYMHILARKGWLVHDGGEKKHRAWKLAGVRVVLQEVQA